MESINISFGTCPSGENCEIIRSINDGTFPHRVSSNETFINHVHEHHPELKTIFPRIQEGSAQEQDNPLEPEELDDRVQELIYNPGSEIQPEESDDDLPDLEEEPVSDLKIVSSSLRACEDGEEKCLLRRAINDRKTPFDMRDNHEFLTHIDEKHPNLRSSFSEENFLKSISFLNTRKFSSEKLDLKFGCFSSIWVRNS